MTAPKSAAVAEAEQPDDAEVLRGSPEEHAHAVADLESVVARGRFVHRDLAVAARRATDPVVDEPERAVLDPRRADRRRPSPADRLAVPADELRVPGDEALGASDTGDRAHLAERGFGDPWGLAGPERPRPLDREVDPGEGLGEHLVEGLLDRVGQNVGRAHEGDPEDHGGGSEREPDPPGQQSPDRRFPHGSAAAPSLPPIIAPWRTGPESWRRSPGGRRHTGTGRSRNEVVGADEDLTTVSDDRRVEGPCERARGCARALPSPC